MVVNWSKLKKEKTCSVFLSSYRNTRGSLGEREMLWVHDLIGEYFEFSHTFRSVSIAR